MGNQTVYQGRKLIQQLDASYAEAFTFAPASIMRCTFAKTRASADPDLFNTLITGTGHSISQAAGNLLIAAGTTANSEALLRSKLTFSGSFAARIQIQTSQRIANNNLYLLLADVIGDNLAAVATSATSLNVTVPGHTFTAENIGQSMFIGALQGSLLGVGGRYAIAAIAGDVISFTVAGFTASSGTVSLFGWNFHQMLYNGTVTTTAQYDAGRKGWASGNTAITTLNTNSAPGHLVLFGAEDGVAYVADQLVASSASLQITPRGSRVANIADETAELALYIWSLNTGAPASSTTFTLGMVHIEEYQAGRVALTQQRPQGKPSAMPVSVAEALPTGTNSIGNIGALVAGTALIGDIGHQVRATAGGLTTSVRMPSSAATTNATLVKASAGRLYKMRGYNTTAGVLYLKLFNKATAPVPGTDTPVHTEALKPNDYFNLEFEDFGLYFATGIGYAITGAVADGDTTALTAGAVVGMSSWYA